MVTGTSMVCWQYGQIRLTMRWATTPTTAEAIRKAALAEDVRVFSHGHSESSHMERSYAPVTIGDYVKVYSGATILPGVTIGAQAIVAAGSLVNRDVPPNMVVAGTPAKVIRERRTGGRSGEELDHLWLF